MRRLAGERRKLLNTDLVQLKENLTDPRTTMRKFMFSCLQGDFYTASYALDLSSLSSEQRRQRGPVLAQQLAVVIQRRSYLYFQEIPDRTQGVSFTWWADHSGRITVDRQRLPDGKDAWVFTRQTVSNIPRMYEACRDLPVDAGYARIGLSAATRPRRRPPQRPTTVPATLVAASCLRGFPGHG